MPNDSLVDRVVAAGPAVFVVGFIAVMVSAFRGRSIAVNISAVIVMLGIALLLIGLKQNKSRREEILRHGVPLNAEVLAVRKTRSSGPQFVYVRVKMALPGGGSAEREVRVWIENAYASQLFPVGGQLTVHADPKNLERIEIPVPD